MTVPVLRSQLDPRTQAFAVGAAAGRRSEGLPERVCRAKWSVAVLSELAEPGRMALNPVVELEGRVVDFMWRCASPTATLMLGCAGEDLSGRTLTQVLGAGALRDAVFGTCHRAFLSRSPQTCQVKGPDWRGSLDVQPCSAGLAVVLMSSSALERVSSAQRVLRELERAEPRHQWRKRPRSARLPRVRSRS